MLAVCAFLAQDSRRPRSAHSPRTRKQSESTSGNRMSFPSRRNVFIPIEFETAEQRDLYDFMYEVTAVRDWVLAQP